MIPDVETKRRIHDLVGGVWGQSLEFGVLSTGEKLAVALVLNDPKLLKRAGYASWLQAADRLGPVWLTAAVAVQHEIE